MIRMMFYLRMIRMILNITLFIRMREGERENSLYMGWCLRCCPEKEASLAKRKTIGVASGKSFETNSKTTPEFARRSHRLSGFLIMGQFRVSINVKAETTFQEWFTAWPRSQMKYSIFVNKLDCPAYALSQPRCWHSDIPWSGRRRVLRANSLSWRQSLEELQHPLSCS